MVLREAWGPPGDTRRWKRGWGVDGEVNVFTTRLPLKSHLSPDPTHPHACTHAHTYVRGKVTVEYGLLQQRGEVRGKSRGRRAGRNSLRITSRRA